MTLCLTGLKTRRLTVIKPTARREGKSIIWECICRCGNTAYVSARSLVGGIGRSPQQTCGNCNDTSHPLYSTYRSMISRCYDKNSPSYNNYGGRGVVVCQRWLDDFFNFLDDMKDRPENHSLDRINVNGNYEPNNCRWATTYEQAWNKREYSENSTRLSDQDILDIYLLPRSTPVSFIAEKYKVSNKTVMNIRCAQHGRKRMLKLLASIEPTIYQEIK